MFIRILSSRKRCIIGTGLSSSPPRRPPRSCKGPSPTLRTSKYDTNCVFQSNLSALAFELQLTSIQLLFPPFPAGAAGYRNERVTLPPLQSFPPTFRIRNFTFLFIPSLNSKIFATSCCIIIHSIQHNSRRQPSSISRLPQRWSHRSTDMMCSSTVPS